MFISINLSQCEYWFSSWPHLLCYIKDKVSWFPQVQMPNKHHRPNFTPELLPILHIFDANWCYKWNRRRSDCHQCNLHPYRFGILHPQTVFLSPHRQNLFILSWLLIDKLFSCTLSCIPDTFPTLHEVGKQNPKDQTSRLAWKVGKWRVVIHWESLTQELRWLCLGASLWWPTWGLHLRSFASGISFSLMFDFLNRSHSFLHQSDHLSLFVVRSFPTPCYFHPALHSLKDFDWDFLRVKNYRFKGFLR